MEIFFFPERNYSLFKDQLQTVFVNKIFPHEKVVDPHVFHEEQTLC